MLRCSCRQAETFRVLTLLLTECVCSLLGLLPPAVETLDLMAERQVLYGTS